MPETAEKTTTEFRSRDQNLVLVRRPERRRYNERGELEVIEGERVVFSHGSFSTDDEELIEWLRGHERCNSRFYEVGNEPGRERPTVSEAMKEIAQAAASSNANRLAAIYEREVNSYDRASVKEAATAALETLEEAAAPADEVEEVPKED